MPQSILRPSKDKPMPQTDFGFTRIPEEEKTSRVGEIFRRVAPRYDLMNDLMSAGAHRLWKRQFVASLKPRAGERFLDLAGGTGDITKLIRATLQKPSPLEGEGRVRGLNEPTGAEGAPPILLTDINPAMLLAGRDRLIDANDTSGIAWACVNAESIPFPDMSFDAVTIAFGIRNVTDIPKALSEIRRVLKPGGRFFCLEFSRVTQPLLAKAYDSYSMNIIPKIGEVVAKDRASYQYLVESIRRFPDQERFAQMLRDAGFANVAYENLSFGVVAIHKGWRV
ncbi:MAG: bifunctional demethylmenaquinone methyltransferase/2-methoxy-6-polyprenyl-1,4-benzoquinol methylase UbiE [Alphaproteobacteria bacterium]|nr:bifunctional demethylmenaquinone methyltransferase/2-methoxy-6-polyprenyl-1,4-benzoquinol methylase UbiE [Alphaproteobacteria bacterium]